MALTVTFDLEDNRRSDSQEDRFVRMSLEFLEFLGQRGIRATFFIVGEIARTQPGLVRRVAEDGHEVGLHGLRHVPLAEVGRGRLGEELTEGRALLQDASGQEVAGFRAPIFSLTPGSAWAVQEIGETGFTYSSSVLPAANPLHGWPGAPRRPCRWSNGVLELPCPVAGAGRARIPFLGGIYLRYVPAAITRRLLARQAPGEVAWSYLHPYDLDADEPFFVMPHAGWLTSRILHTRRRATLGRLEHAIAAAGGAGPTLGERAAGLAGADLAPIGPQ